MFRGLKTIAIILSIIFIFSLNPCYGMDSDGFDPYCISVTFNGDVQSSRGFTWYTDAQCASDLLLAEVNIAKENIDEAENVEENTNEANTNKSNVFSNAKLYQGKSAAAERYTGRKPLAKPVVVHRLTITNLKADTTYAYKVGDAERGVWSAKGTFHTAAPEADFDFVILADSQGVDERDYGLSAQTLRMAMQTVPEADFLIHLGDFVQSYGSEGSFENFAEWQSFFAAAQTELMNTTILPVAGNHDQTWEVFSSHFALDKLTPVGADTDTGAYYAVNYGNTCFLVLNTNEGYQNGNGKISGQQVEWLKDTAALADQQGAVWKILLMHRGVYSFGRHMDSEDIIALRAQLAPLISDLGIDLALQGHDHVYMRSAVLAKSTSGQVVPLPEKPKRSSENFDGEKIDFAVNPPGTTYIIPNVSGSQFGSRKISSTVQVYPEAVYEPDDNDEPVFSEIKIEGNRLVYRAYAYDREGDGMVREIDRYAILKEQKTEVWQPKLSINPKVGMLAATIGFGESGQFRQGFWLLPRLYFGSQ